MNYREHGPPPFHAWYGGSDIAVDIRYGEIRGRMPERATRLILEWWQLHRDQLFENWERARAAQPLVAIEPLE